SACRFMVTARFWALPEGGTGEPRLLHVLRVPIGPDNDGKISAVTLSPDGRLIGVGAQDLVRLAKGDIGAGASNSRFRRAARPSWVSVRPPTVRASNPRSSSAARRSCR